MKPVTNSFFDLGNDPYEQHNLVETDTPMRSQLQQQLLQLLAQTREPYFDVLMQHGVKAGGPVMDVSDAEPRGLAPTWADLIRSSDSWES